MKTREKNWGGFVVEKFIVEKGEEGGGLARQFIAKLGGWVTVSAADDVEGGGGGSGGDSQRMYAKVTREESGDEKG